MKQSTGTPATAALRAAGIPFTLHPYRHSADAGSYGAEAADQLGVDRERIFKTLLADAAGRLVVAVVPVAGRLDLKALARVVGAKKAQLADPRVAERASGSVVGGISPIGLRPPLATVLDASAIGFDTVLVSAGRRGLQLELSPAALVAVTGARTAPIATAP